MPSTKVKLKTQIYSDSDHQVVITIIFTYLDKPPNYIVYDTRNTFHDQDCFAFAEPIACSLIILDMQSKSKGSGLPSCLSFYHFITSHVG
jgi:hypothetical protein